MDLSKIITYKTYSHLEATELLTETLGKYNIMQKIMFNDEQGLTQAVLEGKKTQTRRLIKYPKTFKGKEVRGFYVNKSPSGKLLNVTMADEDMFEMELSYIYPKYKIGEEVAIAQRYEDVWGQNTIPQGQLPDYKIWSELNFLKETKGWKNKMFVRADLMNYRIRITDIRAERLQDISEEDCLAEGIVHACTMEDGTKIYHTPRHNGDYDLSTDNYKEAFAYLIDKTSGKGTWDNNPFVWVYKFELIK